VAQETVRDASRPTGSTTDAGFYDATTSTADAVYP